MKPFFITIPHAGERVPHEVTWLQNLPEPLLMCDVDRFVDRLYEPAIKSCGLLAVIAEWHRYVVDPNRLPEDIDQDSVQGSENPSGKFPIGLHWSRTTQEETLIPSPMSWELHQKLVKDYYEPFHEQIRKTYKNFFASGAGQVFQIDAHSMPSWGTEAHKDPGQERPEIVVSDVEGQSCRPEFSELVIDSYKKAGFEVAYNWPYRGGRVTQLYGQPQKGQHAVQVEMKRALYMDEKTKQLLPEAEKIKEQVKLAVEAIYTGLGPLI